MSGRVFGCMPLGELPFEMLVCLCWRCFRRARRQSWCTIPYCSAFFGSTRFFSRFARLTPPPGLLLLGKHAHSRDDRNISIPANMSSTVMLIFAVFWIKFSDTKEAWLECGVVKKVRSVERFERDHDAFPAKAAYRASMYSSLGSNYIFEC